MDTGKAAGDDRCATEQARRQSGVFAAAAFTVVRVSHNDPTQAPCLVCSGNLCDGFGLRTALDIPRSTAFARRRVERSHEQVIAESIEMAT